MHEAAKEKHPFVKPEMIDRIAAAGGDPDAPWNASMTLDVNKILAAYKEGGEEAGIKAMEDDIVQQYKDGNVTSGDGGAGMIPQLKRVIGDFGL